MTSETHLPSTNQDTQQKRRDFLILTTSAVGVAGAACVATGLVNYLAPSKDVLALANTEVNLAGIKEGQSITVTWRGKPVFVRKRTADEIKQAREVKLDELLDSQSDEARVKKDSPWLVVVGVCTHLGCIPKGQDMGDKKGDFGGWFCPCHGSHYDTSGRIRKGPAPKNLEVPPYIIAGDILKIGVDKA